MLGVAPVHSLQLSEEAKHTAHLHLLVQPALFRQVTDAIGHSVLEMRPAEDGDRPGVRSDDVQDHPDRRRLAGAVRPEQAVHGPLRYDEVHVADGNMLLESLADVGDLDRRIGHRCRLWLRAVGFRPTEYRARR
jgi:hypothetical protein